MGVLVSNDFWWSFPSFVIMIFPETARNIVENGSVAPRVLNRPLLPLSLPTSCRRTDRRDNVWADRTGSAIPRRKLGIPNPLESLRIIFYRDAALVLFVSAIFYAAYYCIQASIPSLLSPYTPQRTRNRNILLRNWDRGSFGRLY
jgi:hypothetical protein